MKKKILLVCDNHLDGENFKELHLRNYEVKIWVPEGLNTESGLKSMFEAAEWPFDLMVIVCKDVNNKWVLKAAEEMMNGHLKVLVMSPNKPEDLLYEKFPFMLLQPGITIDDVKIKIANIINKQ
jgi:hypothetical protein